jgi:stage II sporulation protein M
MKHKIGQVINKHIDEHSSLYVFSVILFLMGIIFGTLTVHSLGYTQQSDLFYYFQQFMEELKKESTIDPSYALYHNFIHYMKYSGVIWLLGLSIVGLPIILILLFLKGVFIGFTVGFLVHQLAWDGFLFSIVAVIPQNMIVVPALLVMTVISISFSLKLIGHLFGAQRSHEKPSIPKYMGSIVIMAFVFFVVSIFETYLSPVLMKMAG